MSLSFVPTAISFVHKYLPWAGLFNISLILSKVLCCSSICLCYEGLPCFHCTGYPRNEWKQALELFVNNKFVYVILFLFFDKFTTHIQLVKLSLTIGIRIRDMTTHNALCKICLTLQNILGGNWKPVYRQ